MSNIFLLADDSDASLDPKTTFRDLWLSLLRNDLVLNCPPVTDQARTREYLTSTLDQIKKKMKSIDFKNKGKTWNYAEIALLDVTLRVLHNKIALLTTMKKLEKKVSRKETTIDHSLNLLSILDALPALEIMPSELASTKTYASTLMKSEDFLNDNGLDTGTRLAIFFATFSDHGSDKLELSEIGDVLTSFGRQAIIKEAQLATSRKTQKEKLAVLDLLVGSDSAGLMHLEKLLAIRQVIASCEDTQKRSNDEGEEKSQEFDLTTMYTILCGTLWRTTEVRRFRLISETMVFMLRTKHD
ncbi:hypothetical protein M7I_4199 [Glarea lozoyensis 74030]|uniref:Uncharacterized protein n=1 Tax=Glarea lozoyensis (strain ATCC 74030 / MF5533) TaxID=1104152 RepID=H0ENJ4_GLAL7|nr:hypothetical protein M7I_4199 [Glarea lozoyensis 74030]